jgi:hypothetical protein
MPREGSCSPRSSLGSGYSSDRGDPDEEPTFRELATDWLQDRRHSPAIRPRTIELNESQLTRYPFHSPESCSPRRSHRSRSSSTAASYTTTTLRSVQRAKRASLWSTRGPASERSATSR